MTAAQATKTFIEVQFPIGALSLESYKERRVSHGKILSLGKWWGEKPLVLTRAIILGAVFPASDDPELWPDDLAIFLRCMTMDNAGMWKRKTEALPAELCYPMATASEQAELFQDSERWARGADREQKSALERRRFYALDYVEQREYCCRVEQIDGPPEESWAEINAYLGTTAKALPELIEQLSIRRYGKRLKVGDAFSGSGAISFEAAELGCTVFASDLNPVAGLLTWGALNLVGGTDDFRTMVQAEQKRIFDEVDDWILKNGFETSEEGWRADIHFYCVEMAVPEWDGWKIPLCPSWVVAPKTKTWVELVPIEAEKRFVFMVRNGGEAYAEASEGTKQGPDIVCPTVLWELFKRKGCHQQMPRAIPYSQLVRNSGGLRNWEKREFRARPADLLHERLYCIRWRKPDWIDERGNERDGDFVYREPRAHDWDVEQQVINQLSAVFDRWQDAGWVPNWRVETGAETARINREKGWTYWHHLFNPRQLLIAGAYSEKVGASNKNVRPALTLLLGILAECSSKLNVWNAGAGGGAGSTQRMFLQKGYAMLYNYATRSFSSLASKLNPEYPYKELAVDKSVLLNDARKVRNECHVWITDPPYADAVNYEELSEVFLAWYAPHLKAAFPDSYTDSMRTTAVKGEDAPFRVAMAECYANLARCMPDDGMQVLMFTHKSTDVWEDLALIMWAAGLQVKQVWSIATEIQAGIKDGNYVQATYNMVLRKRTGDKIGFVDFITPQVNKRVTEVITRMRESQIAAGLARCGYTDTDYLLAAQATAAEVATGYATIDGVDLDAELRTANNQRGRSALRTLMENAKRTATDFLLPPAMDRAIEKVSGGDAYQFWRQFCAEEKFLLKGLEGEAQGVFKLGAFQDLGRAYGLVDYESLLGPTRANDTRTSLPDELARPEALRFDEVPSSDRGLWRYSPTRHIYHALKLLADGADAERAVKHLVDSTDFWNLRTTRLAAILSYLQETTTHLPHWVAYQEALTQLAIGIEHHRG
jgi:adenine-specific DNA methylase